MAKIDWEEVKNIFDTHSPDLLSNFINSDEVFLPNKNSANLFDKENENFSAKQIGKAQPGSWIPLYQEKELSAYFRKFNISPIRAGQAEFFFFKGSIFYDLKKVICEKISDKHYVAIEDFIPLSLELKFQRNENAYLNKALALGIINHFVDSDKLEIFKTQLSLKNYSRLLYGQFGKIKLTNPLLFQTYHGNKQIKSGFQFEVDLVLENRDEIIIFEAKCGDKKRESFSLLQLYYPLLYFRQLTQNKKIIRTIFIDIITKDQKEFYKLVEFNFHNDLFNSVKVVKSHIYSNG
jgi:hypothetical protein